MKSRKEIKALAKEAVGMQRVTAILLYIMVFLLLVPAIIVFVVVGENLLYYVLYLAGMIFMLVASVNMYGEFIKIYKRENASATAVFTEMKVNFLRKLGGMLWFVLWFILWSLLLIIPGIIKLFSYFYTDLILADCPNVKARNALKLSMRITQGHKWAIFVFVLSFLGWMLLPAVIVGVAFVIGTIVYILAILAALIFYIVFIYPYFYTALAGMYVEMRDEALASGRITKADLGWE